MGTIPPKDHADLAHQNGWVAKPISNKTSENIH